jgi:DNA-damage-inducible protein J
MLADFSSGSCLDKKIDMQYIRIVRECLSGDFIMANVQVRVDENLRAQAQTVAASMGLDLASAVRLFLTQMVRENGLPFRPQAEPFYSARNQAALEKAVAELDSGKTVTRTLDELEGMAE